jgi:hypothetical protein
MCCAGSSSLNKYTTGLGLLDPEDGEKVLNKDIGNYLITSLNG